MWISSFWNKLLVEMQTGPIYYSDDKNGMGVYIWQIIFINSWKDIEKA